MHRRRLNSYYTSKCIINLLCDLLNKLQKCHIFGPLSRCMCWGRGVRNKRYTWQSPRSTFITGPKPDCSNTADLMKMLSMLISLKSCGEGMRVVGALRQRTRTLCKVGKVEWKPSLGKKSLGRAEVAHTEMALCVVAPHL